ncbi:hypothetical protein B0H14DRAFT_3593580 [Mycena olivaceomarginata]|nr:hypothetical protein B0H14DRAFT_3593580 [Mycena olivaceomarginata]
MCQLQLGPPSWVSAQKRLHRSPASLAAGGRLACTPGVLSFDFPVSQVLAGSRVTRNVVLKTLFITSPMDTVTEDSMAIPTMVDNQAAMLPRLSLLKIQSYPLASKNPESKQLYTVATIGKCPSDCAWLSLPTPASKSS